MQRLVGFVVMLALVLGSVSALDAAQDSGLTAQLHPWGRFEPGAWRVVRVTTETLNQQGQMVSTSSTETRTTLVEITKEAVTLEIESCVEVVGKRFESEPQTLKQGFHGEPILPNMKLQEPTDGQVVIDEQRIPCKVQQIESVGPGGKTVITVYYSATVAPYVFKRKSVTTDAEGKNPSEATFDVITLAMPSGALDTLKTGFYAKSVQTSAKGTVFTMAVISPDVPGGMVSNSSKEVDRDGQVIRRSTLRLLDYGTDQDQDRSLIGRRRASRHRTRTPTYYGQ